MQHLRVSMFGNEAQHIPVFIIDVLIYVESNGLTHTIKEQIVHRLLRYRSVIRQYFEINLPGS